MQTVFELKDFESLRNTIEQREGISLSLCFGITNSTLILKEYQGIDGVDDPVELYLKVNPFFLTISRMVLRTKRAGLGSFILGYLIEIAESKNIAAIKIENVLTYEMLGFVKKYNFKPDNSLCGVEIGNTFTLDVANYTRNALTFKGGVT